MALGLWGAETAAGLMRFAPGSTLASVTTDLANGTVQIYSGSLPAALTDAITTQVLLASCTFASPAFTIDGNIATAAPLTDDRDAAASGLATWFRGVASDGTILCDGSVGASDADADCLLSSTMLVQHGTAAITSCVIQRELT